MAADSGLFNCSSPWWVQTEIGEALTVSQSTISRAIQAVTLLLGEVLAGYSHGSAGKVADRRGEALSHL